MTQGDSGPWPMRGEVWDVRFPAPVNLHPAVVMSANVLRPRLSSVTVVVITGSAGPTSTHVTLDADSGLSGHAVSYANATDIHTIPTARLHRKRGRLSEGELRALEAAVRLVLAL